MLTVRKNARAGPASRVGLAKVGQAWMTLALAITLMACGSGSGEPDVPLESQEVTVLAAASLAVPFEALADSQPDLAVVYSFGPSSGLVEQLRAGAPADVLATADAETMSAAVDHGVVDSDPAMFAENSLVLAVPNGNPGEVSGLADLERGDLRVVLCEARVPCGRAAVEVLETAEVDAAVDTYATDVSQATALVTLGEADAALIYRTDAEAAGAEIEMIEVPEAANAVNEYYVGVAAETTNRAAAEAVIDQITGVAGREALSQAGFVLP